MIIPILIAVFSLLILVALHELGHFLLARRFGVKVEEFGIGLPPRLFGKRFGETLYSLNLLPIGAFVRMLGEEEATDHPRSFSTKPVWQRAIIVAAGVIAFWIVAALIFMVLGMTSGIPTSISDDFEQGVFNARVQILEVAVNSPAANGGLLAGDVIVGLQGAARELSSVQKVKEVQEFVRQEQSVTLSIQRGNEFLDIVIVPRIEPPVGEGPIGIVLSRTALLRSVWYKAPIQGIVLTWQMTFEIVRSFVFIISNIVSGKGVPPGAQVVGPIGIVNVMTDFLARGVPQFFFFLAILSIYLAIFNILPIPVVDGGHLMFLAIEVVRKKPVSEKLQRNIQVVFFVALISMFLWVSWQDILRIL